MAFGASVRAPTVSSLTCADASKPVIVYWASNNPNHEEVDRDERSSRPTREPGWGLIEDAAETPGVVRGDDQDGRR